MSEDNGTISSPGHPNNYANNTNCTWHITVSPGFVIHLTFTNFTLENSKPCAYDYVQVIGGDVTKNLGK